MQGALNCSQCSTLARGARCVPTCACAMGTNVLLLRCSANLAVLGIGCAVLWQRSSWSHLLHMPCTTVDVHHPMWNTTASTACSPSVIPLHDVSGPTHVTDGASYRQC
jgi:hypothetical protein